jgi:hypothetical protein
MATGAEALSAWLRKKAKTADQVVALEESLLAGRFARYAARRLWAFGLARTFGAIVHFVELAFLFDVFSAKPFIASIALQNVTLVADAFFWGALEGLRRRIRVLGPTSEAAGLVARYMTLASWVSIAAIALPLGVALFGREADKMLHLYALACGVRLAADVLVRTYYSGVFAHGRVHRPMWSVFVSPVLLGGLTVLLWEKAEGYSFFIALLVSVVASRALILVFTDRAYRRFRVPRPTLRLFTRGALGVVDRSSVIAGVANTSTRVGGVILLAAIVPSLVAVDLGGDDATVEPFAFSLHLAAPFILMASQWAFVFYHDWKRVEGDLSATLVRVLERRLSVVAVAVAVVAWVPACTLVYLYVGWEQSWPTLVSIGIAMMGTSVWSSLQMRRFSHGEHVHQTASAIALVAIVAAALAADASGTDVVAFYAIVAAGPWAAIVLQLLIARWRSRTGTGVLPSVASFVKAVERARGPVVVWDARSDAGGAVAIRIAEHLGTRGAVVRGGTRIVWFESPPQTTRVAWLELGAGRISTLARVDAPDGERRRALAERGVVSAPDRAADEDTLAREHAALFPGGFVVRVGSAAPPSFLALPAVTRQAIWRDALRSRFGARGRSGYWVTSLGDDGSPSAIFVAPLAPGPPSLENRARWRSSLEAAEWRLRPEPPTSPHHPFGDDGVKVEPDAGIVEA